MKVSPLWNKGDNSYNNIWIKTAFHTGIREINPPTLSSVLVKTRSKSKRRCVIRKEMQVRIAFKCGICNLNVVNVNKRNFNLLYYIDTF